MRLIANRLIPGDALLVIAGPCAIETEDFTLAMADRLRAIADRLSLPLVFKASFDKANRTSVASNRGPGLEEGLRILARVKAETGLPILTDVHECWQVEPVAEVVDIIQVPAFLARQTDLLVAAAASGRVVNVKKGQFMAPGDMAHVVRKIESALSAGRTAADRLMLCERGTTFGYHDLVVDMRSLGRMKALGVPVIFDATHSVQSPGGAGDRSGGQRDDIPLLARAAVAAGIDGIFIETHPDPVNAWSDAATVWPLDRLEKLLIGLAALHGVRQQLQFDEPGELAPTRLANVD
ncbi:3-deoxy-8-phosphooctulonate synthase [soil metagenome]